LKAGNEWFRAARRPPPRGKVAPRPGRATPRLERLEDRTVPSTSTVTNTNDAGAGSLRQAVLDANALAGPDVIAFALAPADHAIALTGGELAVTDSLAINGPGAAQLTVSGGGLGRVLSVSNTGLTATQVDVRGLTITGGLAAEGGGILNAGGVLTLTDVILSGNRAAGAAGAGGGGGSGLGGGIANEGGALTLVHSTLADNIAQGGAGAGGQGANNIGGAGGAGGQGGGGFGGGIYNAGGALVLVDTLFSGNQALGGAGGAGGNGGQGTNPGQSAPGGGAGGQGGGGVGEGGRAAGRRRARPADVARMTPAAARLRGDGKKVSAR
jgi:hypothetical protein